MIVEIFSGKGGVGKTTCSVSLGYYLSSSLQKTLIIDYDGGHSVPATLGLENFEVNKINTFNEYLDFFIVENFDFQSIKETRLENKLFKTYLGQFHEDDGLLPFCDIAQEFFGLPVDIFLIQKFIILTKILNEAKKLTYKKVIIDVEPTAGLQSLLERADTISRSLENLSKRGIGFLTMLSLGGWPDVATYLKSEYIKNVGLYTKKIRYTAALLKEANYYLVAIPEKSPLKQTYVVKTIIEKFGGKVKGWVINNVRSLEEKKFAETFLISDCPVVFLDRQPEFHNDKRSYDQLSAMSFLGGNIYKSLVQGFI